MKKKFAYETINDIPQAELDGVILLLLDGDKDAAESTMQALIAQVKDKKQFEVFHLSQVMLTASRCGYDLLGFLTRKPDGDLRAYYEAHYTKNNSLSTVNFMRAFFERQGWLNKPAAEVGQTPAAEAVTV